MASALDEQACLLSRAEWKKQLLSHVAIAVQRGNADIMIRDDQRGRAKTDWWILGGDKTHRRRRRRLNPPLYSVSDVPWMRDGGEGHDNNRGDGSSPPPPGGASPSSVIPDSLLSPVSASASSSSSVTSSVSSPDTAHSEGNCHGDELMQVDDASDGAVQWDDSGVSGSYVSGCGATSVLAETVSVASDSSSGCSGSGSGGAAQHVLSPAMELEEMECGREELMWRESGCDVVFDPHTNGWIGRHSGGP